jgi:hypothetical protein
MHLNPIIGLKDNMFVPLIGFGLIHMIPLFNLLPTLSWSVFTTCALRLPSKLALSSTGKGIKSIGVKRVKSIHNFKW